MIRRLIILLLIVWCEEPQDPLVVCEEGYFNATVIGGSDECICDIGTLYTDEGIICDEGYTYYDGVGGDVTYGDDYQVCYYNEDLDVLKDFILLNNNWVRTGEKPVIF